MKKGVDIVNEMCMGQGLFVVSRTFCCVTSLLFLVPSMVSVTLFTVKTTSVPTILRTVEVLHKNTFVSGPRITSRQYIDVGGQVVVVEFWTMNGRVHHVDQRDLRVGETF